MVNKMSEQDIIKKLEDFAEKNDKEADYIINLHKGIKHALRAKFPYKTEVSLNNMAYNNIKDYFNSGNKLKFTKTTFIPFGIFSEAKDRNRKLRNKIYKEWKEPENQAQMIEDGKVMCIKVGSKPVNGEEVDIMKPIKAGVDYKTTKVNGEIIVVDPEGDDTPLDELLWTPGDKIIPRDYRKQTKFGDDMYDNKQYSKPLTPNWKMVLFGIGFQQGTKKITTKVNGNVVKKSVEKNLISDGKLAKIEFYGDLANPSNPKFVCKKNPWFEVCEIGTSAKKWTNEIKLSAIAEFNKEIKVIPSDDLKLLDYETKEGEIKDGIINLINKRITKTARKLYSLLTSEEFKDLPKDKKKQIKEMYKDFKKYIDKDLIPVIDLLDIDKYHKEHRAVWETVEDEMTGEEIKRIKKDNGWDVTDFDSFAVCECSLDGVYSPADKPPKFVISDASLPNEFPIYAKFANGIDSELPDSQVLISLTTSRGNKVYDEDSEEYIVDEENAKAFPKIRGIKVLMKFDNDLVEQILADL